MLCLYDRVKTPRSYFNPYNIYPPAPCVDPILPPKSQCECANDPTNCNQTPSSGLGVTMSPASYITPETYMCDGSSVRFLSLCLNVCPYTAFLSLLCKILSTCVSYAEARNRYRLDVRLSVRPSHAGTVSKRLNILSICHALFTAR